MDKILCQQCINAYRGRHGKVVKVCKNEKWIDTGNVEFLIGELDSYLVVAFEGSHGNFDWYRNLQFPKTVFPNGVKIHTGFYKQFLEVRKRLAKEILSYPQKQTLIFTGHSQGAALATLCTYFMDLDVFEKYGLPLLVTFGSPRVGNGKFVKDFLRKTIDSRRYVNGNDSVALVPTAWMNFRHIDKQIKIGQKLNWYEKVLYVPYKVIGNPLDHYPQEYLKNIIADVF